MKILVLAPHPYYVVRGTPIDLDILLRALTARSDTDVDLLVYAEGEGRDYPNLEIHRTPSNPLTRRTKPGFSLRKLICDILMFFQAWSLVRKHRYDVIHAGEEAVFMAMFFRAFYRIPYVYDLDSSIAQQMTEKLPALSALSSLFNWMEAAAIRSALATAPVCNALADLCRRTGAKKVITLHDISQLEDPNLPQTGWLQRELGTESRLLVYVGNLEVYQGIDLLVESFALAAPETDALDLVIVGGTPEDIEAYRKKVTDLGIEKRTHFLGPRPFEDLHRYLAEADILTAPRLRGINTPMKVFPYLHSGRALLVTDLPTHSQILTQDVAFLANPTPRAFADAIVQLVSDPELRERLGRSGRAFVEANHTFESHSKRVNELYSWVESQIDSR